MKLFALIFALSSSMAFAHDLANCSVFKDGVKVKEIESFDILNFDSKEPEATIDGSLIDYMTTKDEVIMSFSNECDNNYGISFKKSDLKLAKKGSLKIITGKANIEEAGALEDGSDLVVAGEIVCNVTNK